MEQEKTLDELRQKYRPLGLAKGGLVRVNEKGQKETLEEYIDRIIKDVPVPQMGANVYARNRYKRMVQQIKNQASYIKKNTWFQKRFGWTTDEYATMEMGHRQQLSDLQEKYFKELKDKYPDRLLVELHF